VGHIARIHEYAWAMRLQPALVHVAGSDAVDQDSRRLRYAMSDGVPNLGTGRSWKTEVIDALQGPAVPPYSRENRWVDSLADQRTTHDDQVPRMASSLVNALPVFIRIVGMPHPAAAGDTAIESNESQDDVQDDAIAQPAGNSVRRRLFSFHRVAFHG